MKLSFSFPATGCQKFIGVDEERKLRTSYEKHMATEIAADALGEEWKDKIILSHTSDHIVHWPQMAWGTSGGKSPWLHPGTKEYFAAIE
uniref:Small ribosomal subunit protein eS6 n=1 Tax=Sus scrofa TaxID=9823 RepID=A0A4X1VZL0_PIG